MTRDSDLLTSQRLVSLDALRGFDMFWIVAAEGIVSALHETSQSAPVSFIARQLEHVQWEGLRFYDLSAWPGTSWISKASSVA